MYRYTGVTIREVKLVFITVTKMSACYKSFVFMD
jgi:hypothetical protein